MRDITTDRGEPITGEELEELFQEGKRISKKPDEWTETRFLEKITFSYVFLLLLRRSLEITKAKANGTYIEKEYTPYRCLPVDEQIQELRDVNDISGDSSGEFWKQSIERNNARILWLMNNQRTRQFEVV
jgi:hypothetical protein